MSKFDEETAVTAAGRGRWTARLSAGWDIAGSSNGGYALAPVLRAMRTLAEGHPDPVSATTHFLRPARGDADAVVRASVVRAGRTVTTLSGTLSQEGRKRLVMTAAFSSLAPATAAAPWEIATPPPDIPPVEECRHRRQLEQGVDLPLLSRVDVRVHPDHSPAGRSDRPLLDGWIRLADGADPSTLSLPFFADAFPPSLYPMIGFVGWVPTIELTVHVRRIPAAGWLQGRFESHDLAGGRVIESGVLWDSAGRLVAHSRQLCLLLTRG